jgi:hypothetical protein
LLWPSETLTSRRRLMIVPRSLSMRPDRVGWAFDWLSPLP